MSRNLQLQVVLNAIDKATGPIKAIMNSSSGLGKQLKQTRDQLKGLNQQQRDIASYNTQKNAVSETAKKLTEAREKMRGMSAELKSMKAPSEQFQREFYKSSEAVKKLNEKHGEQRKALAGTVRQFKEAGISTKDLGGHEKNLTQSIEAANNKLKDQKNRLAEVTAHQKKLSAAKAQYERTTQLASSMTTAGAGGIGVAYGVKSAADRLLAPGINYGAQMSELQAVSRLDKDDERFKMLKQQARELGASTAFSATDVGAGQTFLARAGFSPEAINSSMQDILDLALANGVDLARTADIASNISGAFKIDPEVEGNMQRVADILSGVSARANVDLEMLGDTMKYLGKAEGLNMSLEQTAAMAGVLGNIGIQSSQAGTTMRAMLDRITAPAAAGAKAMKALGLQVKDASGNMRDMPDIIADVAKATAKMGNVDQAKYLKDIFGAEAGSGMAELVAQQGTGALSKLIEELYNVQGENSRMAATRADNIDGDLKGLASAWEEIGIGITDINEGPLRGLVQQITGILRAIGQWSQRNPELVATIAKVIAVIALLAGVGGALMLTIGSILGPLALMKYSLTVLGIKSLSIIPALKGIGAAIMLIGKAMIASPLGLFAAAAVIAAVLIVKYWDVVKAFFNGFISGFIDGFMNMGRAVIDVFNPVIPVFKAVMSAASKAFAWFKELLAPVSSAKETLEGAASAGKTFGQVLGAIAALTGAALAIKAVGTAVLFVGKVLLANPVFFAIALLAGAAYMVYENWDGIVGGLKQMWADLGQWWSDKSAALAADWEFIAGKAAAAWGSVTEFFSGVWAGITGAFDGGISGVGALILNWSPLGLFYKAMAGVLGYFGIELPGTFSEFGGGLISSFTEGLSAAWSSITEFFTARFEDVKTAFSGGIGGISALIVNWSPLGLFYQVFAGVMEYFGIDLPGKFSEFGAMIMQGLVSGIKNAAGAVKDAVVGMGDSVGGWFKDKLGIKSPSRVFMQFGDDTAEGLALGIAANKDSPLKQVAGMAKQVAAAGAIALSVGVTPAIADNKGVAQNLMPVAQQDMQDQQQRILQNVQPAVVPAVQDQQQVIRQSLMPITHEQQALPALTQNIQQMIISAKQVLPDLTQRIISVFSGPSGAAPELQKKLFNDQPSINFDTRAPIGSPAAQPRGQGGNITNNYTITVTGGGDPKELADEVMRQIEAYNRQQQVRTRSRFGDLD